MVIYLTLKKLRFSSQAICHVNSMISKENPKDSLCFKNVRLATLCFKPQYIVAKNVLKVDKLCFKNGQVLVNGTRVVPLSIKCPPGQVMLKIPIGQVMLYFLAQHPGPIFCFETWGTAFLLGPLRLIVPAQPGIAAVHCANVGK